MSLGCRRRLTWNLSTMPRRPGRISRREGQGGGKKETHSLVSQVLHPAVEVRRLAEQGRDVLGRGLVEVRPGARRRLDEGISVAGRILVLGPSHA